MAQDWYEPNLLPYIINLARDAKPIRKQPVTA
jgi:hypothetical protein